MIAHDMRTPLNAITFSIQAARNSSDSASRQSALDIAERNAVALSHIIECLIDTSLMGKGVLASRDCLPADLMRSAIDQIAPVSAPRGQHISLEEASALPHLFVDGTRIIRVLVNLLSNAVRFTPEGGHIQVRARRRLNDGHDCIVFSVTDDGPGVAIEHIERIFLEGVSFSKGGKYSTGLGLTVCKEIVEAHGGRIWVEPSGRGATFSFSIPILSKPAEAA